MNDLQPNTVDQRPLKILLTAIDVEGGGQVTYLVNLARELVRLGHRVIIGCKPGSLLARTAPDTGAEVRDDFIFRGGLRPRAWCADLARARRIILEQRPDIIHVSSSQDHWVFALADRALGRPVCLVRTRHNTYPVHDIWPNRVLNRDWTDYQIVVCDIVRRTLAENRAFDAARMCSIHNGVDADAFRPDPEARRDARREFGYADADVVCGIAARLDAAKGHEFLLPAVAQLHGEHPNVRLLILGDGELADPLARQAEELGIAPVVHFAGFRRDMARCTQAFDIGVMPSVYCDTSSFSLKEEMAAEVPVVASDYGGLTEIVTDGVEGFVVTAGQIDPLADALGKLAADSERRAEMGRAGRARVLRDFTIQIFARRTVDAYREALRVHGRQPDGA